MSQSDDSSDLGPSAIKPASDDAKFGQLSQIDFDIEFFARVLRRNGKFVDVLRCQGQLLSRKRRHREALQIDQQLVALRPDDAVAYYNLGCSLALLGKSTEAITSLRRALERGYDDYSYLESDTDLDSLRDEPAYRALLREFGIGAA